MTDDSLRPGSLDERFLRALDSILDLVVIERAVRDESGEIVDFVIEWMNNSPVDVAGRRREEMIGRRISELYPVLAGGELIAGYRRVVETGEPLVVDVMPYEDVIDGRPVSGYYTVQASKFEDGVLVASRDITTLETLASGPRVDAAPVGGGAPGARGRAAARPARHLAHRPRDRRGHDVAGVAAHLRRYPRRRVVRPTTSGASPSASIPTTSRSRAAAFEQAVRTGRAVVVEHRVVQADGAIGHVRSYAQPVVDDGRVTSLWGTTQDITEHVANRDAFDVRALAPARRPRRSPTSDRDSARARDRQDVADAAHSVLGGTGESRSS